MPSLVKASSSLLKTKPVVKRTMSRGKMFLRFHWSFQQNGELILQTPSPFHGSIRRCNLSRLQQTFAQLYKVSWHHPVDQ